MKAFTKIPVVDVSALGGTDPAAHAATVAKLREIASSIGFLYVSGHGIPEAVSSELIAAAKGLFDLSLPEKMKIYIGNSRNHRGYVPEGEEVFAGKTPDRKEAFDLAQDLPNDDPDYLAGNPLLGPNQWPENLPGFREAVMAYYAAAFQLGRRLLRGFSEAVGLEPTALDHLVTKPTSQLRLIHYPFHAGRQDAPGIGAHTDYELFTLLLPTAAGLEAMNGSGEWIDVPPVPGALVVNIGDMLEVLSNGLFVATSHRVRAVKEERYSFPLFFACDYAALVRPLPQFVTPERPAAFDEIVAGEHLFAQTVLTFKYLRERRDSGELKLPERSLGLSSFGQEARHPTHAPAADIG
ncbi:MAG: isopenicillin N synthase family oxygenase [Mesorhizobium sp.]|nr:MAG: isopenicillin N synthase family oxygenase [Mesorhizobium sp.]